jgi:hypothetical protein
MQDSHPAELWKGEEIKTAFPIVTSERNRKPRKPKFGFRFSDFVLRIYPTRCHKTHAAFLSAFLMSSSTCSTMAFSSLPAASALKVGTIRCRNTGKAMTLTSSVVV